MDYTHLIALAILGTLKGVVKNPSKKAALREIMLDIREEIDLVYGPEDSSDAK